MSFKPFRLLFSLQFFFVQKVKKILSFLMEQTNKKNEINLNFIYMNIFILEKRITFEMYLFKINWETIKQVFLCEGIILNCPVLEERGREKKLKKIRLYLFTQKRNKTKKWWSIDLYILNSIYLLCTMWTMKLKRRNNNTIQTHKWHTH